MTGGPAPRLLRLVPLIGTGLAAIIGLIFAVGGFVQGGPPDTDAFWLAAQRIRDGQALYPPIDPNADEVYRYGPWFAFIWVPLTYLPQDVTYAAWSVLLVACSVVSVVPIVRRGWAGLALGALLFGALVFMSAYGNPTPLIVATLTLSRVHPVVLGIAGSLKIYPLFLTAGFMAERRWRAVAVAWATAALLWAPALIFGLDHYVIDPGAGGVSVWSSSPAVWTFIAAITIGGLAWLVVSHSPWAWVGGAASIALAVPRVWPGELAYLIPAIVAMERAPMPRDAAPAAHRSLDSAAP